MTRMNEFDRQMVELDKEITALKTARNKSSATLKTATGNASASFTITKDQTGSFLISSQALEITLNFSEASTPITMVETLNYDGNLYYHTKQRVSDSAVRIYIEPTMFTQAIAEAVFVGGGTATCSNSFRITSTSAFNMTTRMVAGAYA